jgi:hypothetical protein
VAEKAGYIVWKDRKLVIFYTNNLAATPTRAIINGDNDEAIACVHGLATLFCWIGTEKMHHTQFDVPATIVAYNLFMNLVDRLDQKRSTNPAKRKETKLYMSLFTYMLDMACAQAHSLLLELKGDKAMSFMELKRRIAKDLVTPWCAQKRNNPKKGGLFTEGVHDYMNTNNPIVEIQNRNRKENPGDDVVVSPRKNGHQWQKFWVPTCIHIG